MTKRQYKLLRFIHRHKPTFDAVAKYMGYADFQILYQSEEWHLVFDDEIDKYLSRSGYGGLTGSTLLSLNSSGIKALESQFTDLFRWRITTTIAVAALILSVIAIIVQ